MQKEYICECGKIYHNSQAFNGHKRNCKVHYISKYGSIDKLNEIRLKISISSHETQKEKQVKLRETKLNTWISEQHKCEKCGCIMYQKFGSGRFCSRACANSKSHSLESRIKLAETLRKRKLTSTEINKIKNPKQKRDKFVYNGPELPIIERTKNSIGYQPRNKTCYPERFWIEVLKSNNINYYHDFPIQKPSGGRGVYRLDFLVDNIDIEIDDSLHDAPNIHAKDIKRDEYLKSLGYIIYRIKWVDPCNDVKKDIVNNQINDLFNFLGKSRIK